MKIITAFCHCSFVATLAFQFSATDIESSSVDKDLSPRTPSVISSSVLRTSADTYEDDLSLPTSVVYPPQQQIALLLPVHRFLQTNETETSGSSNSDSSSTSAIILILSTILGVGICLMCDPSSLGTIVSMNFWFKHKLQNNRSASADPVQDQRAIIPQAFSAELRSYESVTCAICLMDFTMGEMVKKTACKHIFHEKCFDDWVAHTQGRTKCPECTQDPFDGFPLEERADCLLASAFGRNLILLTFEQLEPIRV